MLLDKKRLGKGEKYRRVKEYIQFFTKFFIYGYIHQYRNYYTIGNMMVARNNSARHNVLKPVVISYNLITIFFSRENVALSSHRVE